MDRRVQNETNLNPRPTSSTAVRLAIVFSFDASKFVKRSEIILVLNPRQSNSAPSTPKITTLRIFKFSIRVTEICEFWNLKYS